MKKHFFAIAEQAFAALGRGEALFVSVAGESTDFVRFNHGRVRQAGHVEQAQLALRFVHEGRSVDGTMWLSGESTTDGGRALDLLRDLRAMSAAVPVDPHLLVCTEPKSIEAVQENRLPDAKTATKQIVALAGDRDLVGIYAAGPVFRGLASSHGSRAWRETASFHLDWSVYLSGTGQRDRAAKASHAGFAWNEEAIADRFTRMDAELAVLARPKRTVDPGEYRVYLAPQAIAEIVDVLTWGGFGLKAFRTRQSPLMLLADGARALSPRIGWSENVRGGIAPAWNAAGFEKPDSVALVERGQHAGFLVSPRSAKEYDFATNGADDGEGPSSLDMKAGELATKEAAKAVGDGVLVNNLWYLNYSDRPQGRITGMTRFATFLVEKGEVVAPISVMRFDDSVFRFFGEGLVDLTREREFLPSTSTYGQRSTASVNVPGALIDGFRFTL